jgi:hypothetical protein
LVDLQIVIPLIDSNMVADPAWQYWLRSLASQSSGANRVFLPVALESSAFNVPAQIASQNFLRPAGLPLQSELKPDEIEPVLRSLCKQLTEALCSMLLGSPQDGSEAAMDPRTSAAASRSADTKITLFLSHAKVDGSNPARRIRDYIYTNTQLAAFYDENDIPFGSGFSQIIQSVLTGTRTAALIVVRSAAYASRPWCRREISVFRSPLKDPNAPNLIRLNPILIVDALQGGQETFGVPEFGNATLVGWSDVEAGIEEQIVTLVLREALLRAFHSALGRHLLKDAPSSRVVINWVPDPTTLLLLAPLREANNRPIEICYPGRGLSALELDILEEYFPQVTFTSYERALAS